MNPDKLFDYLDGRLPAAERAALERQLISDPQLQRELSVAREIHARMRSDSYEVFLPAETDVTQRGRKIALRVGAVFIILMAVNVGVGLWLIARHETKNPNRALLETQMRQQIAKALEKATTTLTPAPLSVSEITIFAGTGKVQGTAEQVIKIASQLGGSATKGLGDQHQLDVVADLPQNREAEFRAAIAPISGAKPGFPIPATTETKSFVVHIFEEPLKPD
jgi:anti-sigma factor RsiW